MYNYKEYEEINYLLNLTILLKLCFDWIDDVNPASASVFGTKKQQILQ